MIPEKVADGFGVVIFVTTCFVKIVTDAESGA
jgi:hypothetical protein